MPKGKITDAADDLADTVAAAGRRTETGARQAGVDLNDKAELASARSAARIGRSAGRGEAVSGDAVLPLDARIGSLEDGIRRNPLAAAGAALLVGVVLGRFFL